MYEAEIKRGVWQGTQFNEYGTPVVPIRKPSSPGKKTALHVCGDYSVTVNSQLETHHYPMPTPEKLIQMLTGGYGFTKIDLADAYSQIPLGPESQKRLALSTNQGVLLQKRLPFGIYFAPGYFQEIMDQLTHDLPGLAVYLDDILVSGATAQEHLENLRGLLKRLNDKGLRCRLEKCSFAQPYVEYLGHILSNKGIAKGSKIYAIMEMPEPSDIAGLRSFLGSVQFYNKFLPSLSTLLEPLYRLTRKGITWSWGETEQAVFDTVKKMLCNDTVLAHFHPALPIGIACDASNVGLGVVLFHRYTDGSERPIANASKTLTEAQRNYNQIQKEALAVVYALNKFHQFLYGRTFILVTDHKPLLSLFGPTKATPSLAANRLARWALMLSQYQYTVEYRQTKDHGNADALSRLPSGADTQFDEKESNADTDSICTIKTIGLQLNPRDPGVLQKDTAKDSVLSTVMRYTREGWPLGKIQKETQIADNATYTVDNFKKIHDSLTVSNGYLFYGARVCIPVSLQLQVLDILHIRHFGIQRMKQLARTAVYWQGIDSCINELSHACQTCAEHQKKPPNQPVHPWMFPEKPRSRVHLDHAINFLGSNWLVLTDAYSSYPCIHLSTSTSTKATIDLLEHDFAHFGFPHSLVTDNVTTFTSTEFQDWCTSRGILDLTGAPYHLAANGAAERLIQTFTKSMVKSNLSPKSALNQFLIQYRRTPLAGGYSPSELLNGRQIRTVKPGVYFRYVDDTYVIFSSELDCDCFHGKLNVLHPALKFTVEKEQNNSLTFLDVLVEKEGTGFLTSVCRKPTFTGQYIRWNSFSPKARKICLIKTLVHRALMICSRTKLGSELDRVKQLLIENGYPDDVLISCIKQKLANFAAEKPCGPEKCPVYLKLLWIGNVSSTFENQINKAITSCFYAVKPRMVYNNKVMIPSAKKDSVPTTQKSCVVYKFLCRCEARYLGRTTQRLADRIKQPMYP